MKWAKLYKLVQWPVCEILAACSKDSTGELRPKRPYAPGILRHLAHPQSFDPQPARLLGPSASFVPVWTMDEYCLLYGTATFTRRPILTMVALISRLLASCCSLCSLARMVGPLPVPQFKPCAERHRGISRQGVCRPRHRFPRPGCPARRPGNYLSFIQIVQALWNGKGLKMESQPA